MQSSHVHRDNRAQYTLFAHVQLPVNSGNLNTLLYTIFLLGVGELCPHAPHIFLSPTAQKSERWRSYFKLYIYSNSSVHYSCT